MIGRLYINGIEIDLAGDVAVPITYSIADIKNPEKRKRSSSKTIKIPGTKRNMQFFSSTYQMSLTALESGAVVGFEFDPTLRVECQYFKDGIKIFDGLIQLLTVSVTDKVYTFNCCMFSDFVDLFQALGDITVAELGWNEYTHELNFTNIENSWDTSVVVNGTPTANFTGSVPDGFGYLYPVADYGFSSNLLEYKTNDIFPHVYVKEVIEKCLGLVNQSISSTFMGSELFKRLAYGYGGGQKITISTADIATRRIKYNVEGLYETEILSAGNQYIGQDFTFGPHYIYYFNFSQHLKLGDNFWCASDLVTDDLAQFDETANEITIANPGLYNVEYSGDIDAAFTINGTSFANNVNLRYAINVFRNGARVGVLATGNITSSTSVTVNANNTFYFLSGDKVHLELQVYSVNTFLRSTEIPSEAPYFDFEITVNTGTYFDVESVEAPVVDGDTIYVAKYLPNQKASDFFRGIMTMFNLYLSEPDADGVVRIEPLNDYYSDTTDTDNWTELLDHSKEYTISPASNIEGKNYVFKWAQDEDAYNKQYRQLYGSGYGDYIYQVPSTFQKGDRVFEVPFAQTVPVEVPGTNMVIPTIISVDEISGAVSPYKGKPRIYIYSGLRSINTSWVLKNSADNVTTSSYNEYPCCTHLDNIDVPTFDLNFGYPVIVYWTATTYTIINLFSEYHERFVREITGKDSKILSAYFKLSPLHVLPNTFQMLVNINGVVYRKNEIKDFAANNYQTTYCELVRVVEASSRRTLQAKPLPATLILVHAEAGDIIITDTGSGSAAIDVPLESGGEDSVLIDSNVRYG